MKTNFYLKDPKSTGQMARRPSTKVDRLRKALGEDVFFHMEIDGIDCSIYRDEWKNTKITTEVVSINLDRSEYE